MGQLATVVSHLEAQVRGKLLSQPEVNLQNMSAMTIREMQPERLKDQILHQKLNKKSICHKIHPTLVAVVNMSYPRSEI